MTARSLEAGMVHRVVRSSLIVGVLTASLLAAGCVTDNSSDAPQAPKSDQPVDHPDVAKQIAEARQYAANAQKMERDGNIDGAIDEYARALRTYRDLAPAWNNLGLLLMQKKQNMAAAEAFSYASELSPDDPRPVSNLGSLWESLRYYAKAAEYYDQALQRDPANLDSLRGYIRCCHLMDSRTQLLADRIQTALQLEQDPTYRAYFERQKIVTDGILRERPSSVANPMGQ